MLTSDLYSLNYNSFPLILRMAKHNTSTRSRRRQPHQRRASTPSTPIELIKQGATTTEAKRQRQKKQRAKEQRQRRAAAIQAAARRARRERWGSIALETQNIVLGNGQYVEERPVPSLAASVTQPSEGQGDAIAKVTVSHNIAAPITLSKQRTVFYDHFAQPLNPWKEAHPIIPSASTQIEFSPKSTLNVARQLLLSRSADPLRSTDVGVLSFASAKRNNAHLNGSSEQEDVLKRHSSLLACLGGPAAQQFYKVHAQFNSQDGSGLRDHAMLYSPAVVVFRKDGDDKPLSRGGDSLGGEFIPPYTINVVSSVPVNAAAVRAKHTILPGEESLYENGIRGAMKERMGRLLRLFELYGDKALVLGVFGCGSYENKVETIARIWAELLVCGETVDNVKHEARYKNSFDKVVFAVPGKLFEPFKKAFEMRVLEEELTNATLH